MATFRGSNHQVGASSVWTNGDLANLINNLYRQSIRAGATGDYERGLRDMAQSVADATNTEIDLYPDGRYDHYNTNVHAERIIERYERIEERHERTVERYAPSPSPAVAPASMPSRRATFAAPVDMTGDDVNVTAFDTAVGRLVEREIGFGWIGNDGSTAFWSKSDWQQISAAEAESWQLLVPERWIVLARHAYAASQRRQLADNRRLLR